MAQPATAIGFVSVALPTRKMAARSSAACCHWVLLLLMSTATLSAAVSAPRPSLCTMPSPAPEHLPDGEDALPLISSLDLNAGYFFGGHDLHFAKDESNETDYSYITRTRSFSLLPLHAYRTSDTTIFHVAATLTLSGGRERERHYVDSRRRRRHHYVGSHSVTFSFEGYYTNGTTSAELCMTGRGSYSEENGSTKRLRGVDLHLRVPVPFNITRPFITGSLKGADFETISLVAYAEGDSNTYHYGKSASCPLPPPSPAAAARGALQAFGANFSCAHLKERLATSYKLQYDGDAHASASSPERLLHISELQCTEDGSVRAYAAFSNDTMMWRRYGQPRPPYIVKDVVVVAEGHWDSARSTLCLRACRVKSSGASMAVSNECDMGISFWFPGAWTIRERSAVAGRLWNSSKAADGTNDGSGVGGVISASSIDVSIHRGNFSQVMYEYTMVEQAKKHYYLQLSKLKMKVKGPFAAPNYTDHDFEFHFYGTSDDMVGSSRAYPVTIGSAVVYGDQLAADDSFSRNASIEMNKKELLNISYDIREHVPPAGWVRPKNESSYSVALEERRMTAEGVFDPKTGILCMMACREYNSSTTDCQILVTIYLASQDGKALGHGKGAISSLRNKTTDPLFFEKVDIRLFGTMYSGQISESISRMDFESILLVISTTLPCIFTVLQIFHAKRRPEAAAATSVTMLVVLALGYVAPLVVSSEALFLSRRRQYTPLPFQSYVPYELSQAMLRAPTLIALLLQMRLIQLALSARKAEADLNKAKASSSVAERRALWLCAPLYLIGGALTIIVHVVNAIRASREDSLTVRVGPEPATLWEDLVSSAGLAQDAFLLPQVVMNALSSGGSRVGALSQWFYIGGTVVRAMPHVYDVARAQGYLPSSKPSYVYASPRYDRYGVAWDIVVPCAALLLAVVLFLQQLVGSARPLFPSQRRLGEYQMVSSPL